MNLNWSMPAKLMKKSLAWPDDEVPTESDK